MAVIWSGSDVAEAMTRRMIEKVRNLEEKGILPTLCIIRVGSRPDDLAYENGAIQRCEAVGVKVKRMILPVDVKQDAFDRVFMEANRDPAVHGILYFRPLPGQLDEERIRPMLDPWKDVDGCTDLSLSGVFTNMELGFAPCCAQAVMELLHHYGVDPKGKKVAVIGRSLVIGRPVSMMLMHENATVATLHTKTNDLPSITREADILVVAAGCIHLVRPEYTNPDQIVIDVGINWDPELGGITGDVDFEAVEPVVSAITPVPGGVGSITSCVLVDHVIEAARRAAGLN